jgi:arylsulfatase A-like enzyme
LDAEARPGLAIRAFGLVVAAVLPLVGSTGCARHEVDAGPRARHVVLISLDTTRADQLGLYGNPTVRTPHLDRLAAESIVLDDFMTVVPTTLASHVSLFTGKYPHTHGTPRNGFLVHEQNVMLAEILRERGFATAGFAASFALDSRFQLAQGFDHWDERFERFAWQEGHLGQNERSAESVTGAVLDWLDRDGVPERLFLFAHYFDPHTPYEAPPPWDTLYDPSGREGLPDWVTVRREGLVRPGSENEIAARLARQYAAEISYMDHHVGRLLDGLRERGILDEALLVVTSDHGENFWEHGAVFDHGWTTYQTTMRGVGIIRLPGAGLAGSRIGGVAASIDVLPTVLAQLGIPAPDGIDGEAIDLARSVAEPLDRVRFGQATKPWQAVETDPRWTNMAKARCVRAGKYKLVQVPYAGLEELYDLEADPAEEVDLLADPATAAGTPAGRLREELEAWAASARPLPSRFDPSQRDETIERLRALGYLGGGDE